ncbi:MAG: carboxypeptidase regulatory-like domain-containing protein [Nitrospiraceae bacterium]
MKWSTKMVCAALVGAAAFVASPATAYDVIEVQNGGTIEGRITLSGPLPEPKGFNLVTFPDPIYCGRISNGSGWRLLHDFIVGPEGGLQDTIVLLEGVEAGKPFDMSVPLIEARDCKFQPFVTIVRNGHAVEVMNMDPVMHDIQGYETSVEAGNRVLFNSPLKMNHNHRRGDMMATHEHDRGRSQVGPIYLNRGRRTFYMQCGFHAFMESWAMAVNNPYYAVTTKSGEYKLENIPPGTYQLVVWHPQQAGPAIVRTVTVQAGSTLTEHVAVTAPTGLRSAHKVIDNPRFGNGSLGFPLEIKPLLEHQQ